MLLIDLNERSNRLIIGIKDESSRGAADARVRELDVPAEAEAVNARVRTPRP